MYRNFHHKDNNSLVDNTDNFNTIVNDPNNVALSAIQWVGNSTELNAKLVSLSIQKYA